MEPPLHPQHALAVYAEALVAGARVAVFGDASMQLAERLVGLGARAVFVWDPDEERARLESERSPRGTNVRPYSAAELDARLVDVAVIPDLRLFEEPAELMALVRRMVGEEGVAIVASPNRDVVVDERLGGFDYYELFDLVAAEFDAVRMVAQLPFHGVALAELGGDGESPTVSVDTQLAEDDRAPEGFVALAGQRDVRLDMYAIVELPFSQAAAPEAESNENVVVALAQAQLRAELLESRLDELRAAQAASERVAEKAVALEGALHERSAQFAVLEAALAASSRQAGGLSAEVEELRSAAEVGRVAAIEVEELARKADRAEHRVRALEQEVALAANAHSLELGRLEEALRDRAQSLRLVEAEVARREQMVRDLVGTLDEAAGASAPTPAATHAPEDQAGELAEENARLRDRLDALALDLARREGEGQASSWTIAELERKLSQAPASEPVREDGELRAQLSAALDELDALRRALAQEHEARLRVESGDELAGARAEIERQAALLRQLEERARELESGERTGLPLDRPH
jgi:hypothetical protein